MRAILAPALAARSKIIRAGVKYAQIESKWP